MHLTTDPLVTIGDFTVEIKPHAPARRMTLRYNVAKSRFVVTVPRRAGRKTILSFLNSQQEWMHRQAKIMPKTLSVWEQGGIPIHGRMRRIVHTEGAGVKVTLTDDTLQIICRKERLERAFKRFLVQHAQDVIVPLAREKAERIDKRVARIGFRDTSSRWGSCSADNSLSFSWRLVMAPDEVIDYVVAHEVAHLRHFDHSDDFWTLCRTLSVNYTIGKHWLKLNGPELQALVI